MRSGPNLQIESRPAKLVIGIEKALSWSHVLGTGAFWPLTFRESHLLSFVQLIETHALECFGVKEQVFGASRVDKSKTLVRQSFNRAFSHVSVFLNRFWERCCSPEHSDCH